MNEFRDSLERIVGQVDGMILASVMGMDGLPVDTVAGPALASEDAELEVSALFIEFSTLIEQARRSAQMFAAGGLDELAIKAENFTTIIRLITPEYYLALALAPDGNFGKARYLARLQAPVLARALA